MAVVDVLPHYFTADHQDETLIRITLLLPSAERVTMLQAIGRIHSVARVKRLLPALIQHLGKDSWPMLHALLCETMLRASEGSRSELLSMLNAWMPVISQLGGDIALLQSIEAIDDAGNLWP